MGCRVNAARKVSAWGSVNPPASQQARASAFIDAGGGNPALTTLQPISGGGSVIDPDTGLAVPVLPVNPEQQSTPIIQPVPETSTPQN